MMIAPAQLPDITIKDITIFTDQSSFELFASNGATVIKARVIIREALNNLKIESNSKVQDFKRLPIPAIRKLNKLTNT